MYLAVGPDGQVQQSVLTPVCDRALTERFGDYFLVQNIANGLLARIETAAAYLRILQTPADFAKLVELKLRARMGRGSGKSRRLRLRSLGGNPVSCRALQADTYTMRTTFLDQFHLPPMPLPAHPVIVDLGSNIGYTVADLAFRYPNASVLGVEMDCENAALARRNTSWLGDRVRIVHAAVWVEDGVVSYGGDEEDAFAVLSSGASDSKRVAPAKRLRSLLADHNIDRVDYLKMDIEGAEKFVLSQDAGWLDAVQSMKVELHPPVSFDWCREVLQQRGFYCWKDDRHHNAICAVRPPLSQDSTAQEERPDASSLRNS